MAILNTHSAVKSLVQQGFTEGQAESFVEIINEQNNQLATKADINQLRTELKGDIAKLNGDIAKLNGDVVNIKENMATKHDLANIKIDIFKWMIPLFLTIIGLIITSFFK